MGLTFEKNTENCWENIIKDPRFPPVAIFSANGHPTILSASL